MKRITFAFMSTISALVLLFGYRTSTSSHASGTVVAAAPAATGSSGSSGSSGSFGSSGSSGSGSTSSSSGSGTRTYTGSTADTRWGPVQVRITVTSGRITAVNVLQYPDSNGRDAEINQYALPDLVNETLKAQSDKIDMISGATYTSEGYLSSLQSALDQAGLA